MIETETIRCSTEEAAPCPWCGELPVVVKQLGLYTFGCIPKGYCSVEPRLGGNWASRDAAIEVWNKRHDKALADDAKEGM